MFVRTITCMSLAFFCVETYGQRNTEARIICVNAGNSLVLAVDDGNGSRSQTTLDMGSGDVYRGFSWDGTYASFITYCPSTNRNVVRTRRFDGTAFSGPTNVVDLGSDDNYRGWSYDGTHAAWLVCKGGENTLFVRRFDQKDGFSGEFLAGIYMGKGDAYRGFSYDGTNAWWVDKTNGRVRGRRFSRNATSSQYEFSGGELSRSILNIKATRGYDN